MKLPDPALLIITDRLQARRPLEEIAEAAFAAGCRWLSLREKDLPPPERQDLLRRLVEIGRKYHASVTVHEDVAAAAAAGAAGIHLPRDGDVVAARRMLGADALIGVSAHDINEIARAEEAGADYVTLSPIFPSAGKPGYPALGIDELADCAAKTVLPVIALGGIGTERIPACLAAGAAGVAAVGAVMSAGDTSHATTALILGLRSA